MCNAILSLTSLVFPLLLFFGEKSRCSFKNNIYDSSCTDRKNMHSRLNGLTRSMLSISIPLLFYAMFINRSVGERPKWK